MSMNPDQWGGQSVESRADVEPLDALHEERRAIIVQLAPLKALHGSFGVWDAKRKQILEAIKVRVRMELRARDEKATDSAVDALAHADEQYARFLDESERGKVDYITLDTRLTEITDRIKNRELCLLVYNAEARLAR